MGDLLVISSNPEVSLYGDFALEGESVGIIPPGEVYNVLQCRSIDLLLLDWDSDAESGLILLRDLKTRFPRIPVVIVAGQSSEQIAVTAFRFGARDYFRKPFNILHLRDTLARLLHVKRSATEKREFLPPGQWHLWPPSLRRIENYLSPQILRAVNYMERQLCREISLEDLAAQSCMSRFHFCRKFKESVGMSPLDFLRFLRVQRSKELLKQKDLPISVVAMRSGFTDSSSFYRSFRKFEGITPSAYKDSL